MKQIEISGGLMLVAEPAGKKLRIIVAKNGAELACRKETPGNLRNFVTSGESRLFKGRLQLIMDGAGLSVSVKNVLMGRLQIGDFEQIIR